MPRLPNARDRTWGLVFVVATVVLAGALLLAGSLNRGQITAQVVLNITLVSAVASAVLSGLGFFGARLTVLGAAAGIGVGYVQMVVAFVRSTDGFGDLAGLAGFMLLATVGFGVGAIADVVRWVLARRRGTARRDV